MRNVPDFIRKVRAKLGLTQVQLAQQLGCSKGNISAWENELHSPSYIMLARMSEMSGVPMPHDQLGDLLEAMNIDYKQLKPEQLDMIRDILTIKQDDIGRVREILSVFVKAYSEEPRRRHTDK